MVLEVENGGNCKVEMELEMEDAKMETEMEIKNEM